MPGAIAAELLRLKDGLKPHGRRFHLVAQLRAAELLRLKDGLKPRSIVVARDSPHRC